jgi:hypothetical protein
MKTFMKINLLLLGFLAAAAVSPAAAQEREEEGIEIPAEEERQREEETAVLKKIEEITEEGEEIPEVPKPLKDRELTPAEKERMAQLDQERAEGDLTDPEYGLETDALHREANIKF